MADTLVDQLFDNTSDTHSNKETEMSNDTVELDDVFKGREVSNTDTEDISSILNFKHSAEEAASLQADLFIESGEYVWSKTGVTFTSRFLDQDKHSNDIAQRTGNITKGRFLMIFSGGVVNRKNNKTYRYSITASPDVRFLKDKEGNLTETKDNFSKHYAMMLDLYFNKYEKQAESPAQVAEMMKKAAYAMSLGRGTGQNTYFNGFKEL